MYCSARTLANGADSLTWLLTDHLGSAQVTAAVGGAASGVQRYSAFGEVRSRGGEMPTAYQYTGQLSQMEEVGLYHYGARWFDPAGAHFTQADTLIPELYNPLDVDRYAYGRGNPLKYTDPTGHMVASDNDKEAGCITMGSPRCITDKYYGASPDSEWLQDLELYYYHKVYPDYNVMADPLMEGPAAAIFSVVATRGDCAEGSSAHCMAWGFLALGSPGLLDSKISQAGASSNSGTVTNTVPLNLSDDVYPQAYADTAGRIPSLEVRIWYNNQLKRINTSGPRTEEFARQVHAQRNSIKVRARELMVNRAEATMLDHNFPIQSFDYYVRKYSAEGYSGDALWDRIILGGISPNQGVNSKYGIK